MVCPQEKDEKETKEEMSFIVTLQVYPNTTVQSVTVEAASFEVFPYGVVFYDKFRDPVASFKDYITINAVTEPKVGTGTIEG